MSTDVIASIATEFAIGPACRPRIPSASISPITTSRAVFILPHTRTSQSMGSWSCNLCAATLCNADTTLVSAPNSCCVIIAADPASGNCTVPTFGGFKGTVVSTTIFSETVSLILCKISA